MIAIEPKAELDANEFESIFSLWNSEYPTEFTFADASGFEEFLAGVSKRRHFVARIDGIFAGWLISFDRAGERWFSIIINRRFQGRGIGVALLDAAFEIDDELNGWVVPDNSLTRIDGEPYKSPLGFYLKYGFNVVEGETFAKYDIETVKIRLKRP